MWRSVKPLTVDSGPRRWEGSNGRPLSLSYHSRSNADQLQEPNLEEICAACGRTLGVCKDMGKSARNSAEKCFGVTFHPTRLQLEHGTTGSGRLPNKWLDDDIKGAQ